MPTIPLSARPWGRIKAQVYAEETHCWRCGEQVDFRLQAPHPRSKSVDHVTPRAELAAQVQAGQLTMRQAIALAHHRGNARLAHLRCNTSAQARRPELTEDNRTRRW